MTQNNQDSEMALETSTSLQEQLLQNLRNELDTEREASASVADEALAMILRLQGEKASVKMEAEQYKHETLSAQERLLQKLRNELHVEREASASAASEALATILRLRGENSAVKMEVMQHKRLADEKLRYAEESMEILQEQIYQKEIEIAALNVQVEAYKHKLSSLGFENIGPNGKKKKQD